MKTVCKDSFRDPQPWDLIRMRFVDCELPAKDFLKKKHKKIRDLKTEENFSFFFGCMFVKIANLAGIKGQLDPDMNAEIKRSVLMRFHALSLQEVYYAFMNERDGVYGDRIKLYGVFDQQYVVDVLSRYKKWKADYIKSNPNLTKKPVALISENKERKNIEACERDLKRLKEEFEETGVISSVCVHVYDYLYKQGKLPKCTDYKKEIFEKAKKIELSESKKDINRKNNELIKSILSNKSGYTISIAKKLVLIDYFKKTK